MAEAWGIIKCEGDSSDKSVQFSLLRLSKMNLVDTDGRILNEIHFKCCDYSNINLTYITFFIWKHSKWKIYVHLESILHRNGYASTKLVDSRIQGNSDKLGNVSFMQ